MDPDLPIKQSATVELVAAIERLVAGGWDQVKRHEAAELVRAYRFEQVAAVLQRVQTLIRESGNKELSEKVFLGKF